MDLPLTDEQAEVLDSTLREVIGELSGEIAGTDNAAYRGTLTDRRDILREVAAALAAAMGDSRSRAREGGA